MPTEFASPREAARAVQSQSRGDSIFQLLSHRPTALVEDVHGPRYRISRHGSATGERFEHDQPEGIGAAWENEHVGTGIACELVLRKVKKTAYRIIICTAILAILFLVWAELAVGIFGTPFAGS